MDEVHLWLTWVEEAGEPELLQYRAILPDEERASTDRFYFESGRRQHLITRALVRAVLSRYCDVPVEDWRFVRDSHGRPHVAPRQQGVRGLPAFNLSHTRGLIACAVTGASSIGVDVEHVHDRKSSLDIAGHYFAHREAAALRALPQSAQTDRFFHYWTLKESYIKALGKGLSIPLRDFAFDFQGERRLSGPEGWCFWLCRPSPEHVAAVCVAAGAGAPVRLTTRRLVPLRSEAPFDCEVLRASGA